MKKKRVLFICIKNASRSPMAEHLARKHLARKAQFFSAGIHPGEEVQSTGVKAMREVGVNMSRHEPKHISAFHHLKFDVVIKMDVPDLGDMVKAKWIETWPIPDPAVGGLREYRRIRDMLDEAIRRRLAELLR